MIFSFKLKMETLPKEIIVIIFDFLEFNEILELVIVSKRFFNCIESVCEKRIREQYGNNIFKHCYNISNSIFLRVLRENFGLLKMSLKKIFEAKELTFTPRRIPEEIKFLRNCKKMGIHQAGITFPKKVHSCLKTLEFFDCKIRNCPLSIRRLVMGGKTYIENISELQGLRELELFSYGGKYDFLVKLRGLKYLAIKHETPLLNFPFPPNIEAIKIKNGTLEVFPGEILKNFWYVDLSNNKLGTFPGNLFEILKLKIGGNRIKNFPDVVEAPKLNYLSLKSNPVGKFPRCILMMENLKILDLCSCGIKNIPKDLSMMENLEELNLDGNSLQYIPRPIATIPFLRVLKLSNNRIKKMSHTLFSLDLLEKLYLDENPISFDERILLLPNLKELYLRLCRNCETPISDIIIR